MIAIWNKQTRQIIDKTNDHTFERNYRLKAQGKGYGFFSKVNATAFPEPGYKINTSGEYVPFTYTELVAANLAPALAANQKLVVVNGVETPIQKSDQEQITEGLITLADVKSVKKTRLYTEATIHLSSAKSANGYICSDAAQKIALASIQMKDVASNDVDKLRMTQQGILYSLEKAREVLDYCAAVTASFRTACAAVDSAQNLAQVDSIKLAAYL